MSYRNRLTIVLLVASVLPLVALSLVLRRDMMDRATNRYQSEVEQTIANILTDLDDETTEIISALSSIRQLILADNSFRLGLNNTSESTRRYVVNFAEDAMAISGLSTLHILDGRNRILSSGHFRNEFDRIDTNYSEAVRAASTNSGSALVEVRTADSQIIVLSAIDTFELGDAQLNIIGGVLVDDRFRERLQGPSDVIVSFDGIAVTEVPSDGHLVNSIRKSFSIPFVPLDRSTSQTVLTVAYPLSELDEQRTSMDRWLLVVGGLAVLLATLLAGWLGKVFSRPITALSAKTQSINLDNLNANFHSSRSDEIGDLSRTLGKMTSRLRKNRRDIREAEHRAVVGDMSRQVNHDIKNGLTPIRNIVEHLNEIVDTEPNRLAQVFSDRRSTLESSIDYLRQLAANYSKLSVEAPKSPVSISKVVSAIVSDLQASGFRKINVRSDNSPFVISASPLVVRRIFENLIGNAIDASDDANGSIYVDISTSDDNQSCEVSIRDEGPGIPHDQQQQIFEDFFTTKEDGTGLGLSVVRRLVMDLHGSVHVESSVGHGATFTVVLPLS